MFIRGSGQTLPLVLAVVLPNRGRQEVLAVVVVVVVLLEVGIAVVARQTSAANPGARQ